MHNAEGEQVWERKLDAFGKAIVGDNSSCPFMYQGQYYDAEIDLAYNRFRYYDPEDGRYISQDPIGLDSGEINFYSYVDNPNTQIDGLGLNSTTLGTKIGAVTGDAMENHHLIPEQVWKENQQMFDDLGMDMDGKRNGRLVAGSENKRSQLGDSVYHRGSHPQYSHSVRSRLAGVKRKWKPGINDGATVKRIRRLQRQLNAEIKKGKVPRSKNTYTKIG